MESTYVHLKYSDHIREARDAFDSETEGVEIELTPEVCPDVVTIRLKRQNPVRGVGLNSRRTLNKR